MSKHPIVDAAQELAREITAMGIRCTLLTPSAHPPCAVLRMPAMSAMGNQIPCTSRVVVWELFVIAKGSGDLVAWEWLDAACADLFAAYGPAITSCEPDEYVLRDDTLAPAYRLNLQTVI